MQDGHIDPLMTALRRLPAPAPSPAHAEDVRRRCHERLTRIRPRPAAETVRPFRVVHWLAIGGLAGYIAAAIVQAIEIVL